MKHNKMKKTFKMNLIVVILIAIIGSGVAICAMDCMTNEKDISNDKEISFNMGISLKEVTAVADLASMILFQ